MFKRFKIPTLASLCLLLVLPGAVTAQEQLAAVDNFGDALVFHPLVEFAQLVLTVNGPCDFQYRQVVSKGEPIFRLDPTTIDGAYTYDLVRIESIDPVIVEILQKARQLDDEETPRQLCRDGKLPPPPASQSEGFQVTLGRIIYDPGAIEKGALRSTLTPTRAGASSALEPASGGLENMAAADFVINDDLIVDGSACIGFDCVNGESFGFDTIRLKENNLRIKFDDTSTIGSFPRNDWQLTANDSANGGASKFSIDDITNARTPFTVEANARSHSLYVDDGGRIGSRTSTPSTEIHTVDGDTPTLRLQQDGSSGFAPQTWDVAGNETNFFVRDVTNGSALPFRIRPGAPSSSIFIDVDGDVGLGTSSPAEKLHLSKSGDVAFSLQDTSAGGERWLFKNNTANGAFVVTAAASGGSAPFKVFPATPENTLVVGNAGGAQRVGIGTVSPAGTLDVNGEIFQRGGLLHADYVFEPGYPLKSIDEQASFMWANGHLPAIPQRQLDENGQEVIELGAHQRGLVEELEKAHIYIEQLHQTIQRLEAEEQQKDDTLASLEERLARLEASLQK